MPEGDDPRPQKIQDSQEEILAIATAAHLLDVDNLETGINKKLKTTIKAKEFDIDFKNYMEARKKTLVSQSSKSFLFGATSTVSLINVERKKIGLSRHFLNARSRLLAALSCSFVSCSKSIIHTYYTITGFHK